MREWLIAAVVFGCASGSVRGQGAGSEAMAARPGLVRVSSEVMAGLLRERKAPVYPPEARAAGISGTVVVRAVVGKTGQVEDAVVVNGPEMLRQAALDSVRGWVYRPYLLNGEPTAVDTTVTMQFHLGGISSGGTGAEGGGTGNLQTTGDSDAVPPTQVLPKPRGPVRISGGVLQGLLEEKVDPVYPPTEQAGAVVMKVRVDREGAVAEVTAVSGPESLRAASVEAVKQWAYRPYLLNGEPTEVESTVTVMFTRH